MAAVDILKADISNERCDDLDSLRQETYKQVTSIDFLSEPVSYVEFFEKYLLCNRACILGRWATEGWRSRTEWVTQDGSPNLDFLLEHFGQIYVCGTLIRLTVYKYLNNSIVHNIIFDLGPKRSRSNKTLQFQEHPGLLFSMPVGKYLYIDHIREQIILFLDVKILATILC